MLFDQSTGTLFCGDLFGRTGTAPATTVDGNIDAAIAHDQLMHGPTFVGDAATQLILLADYFDARLAAA